MPYSLQPITADDVKQFIKNLNDLSTIPVLLGKILKTTQDENASAVELLKLINYDQALAQRVLRMANSAAFARSGQIRDIDQAIMFLGFERIRSIAVGMTVMSLVPSKGSFAVENLWIHGYEVAFLASALTDLIPLTSPGECFLAGLLHDIGRTVFCSMDQKKFMSIGPGADLLEWEMTLFGSTHADAGAWLIEELDMPKDLAQITKYHHQPEAAKEQKEATAVIALADALSSRIIPCEESDGCWNDAFDRLLTKYSITEEDIGKLGEKLIQALPDIEKMFTQA
jgi:HD-like signal output (HDOD) protein